MVRVYVKRFWKGEIVDSGDVDGFIAEEGVGVDDEDITKEVSPGSAEWEFERNVMLFQFTSIGDSDWIGCPTDDPVSSEAEMIGWEEVVSSYWEELRREAEKEFAKPCISFPDIAPRREVCFLTLWSVEFWQDYEGEWDSSIEMLGRIVLGDLEKAVVYVS